MEDFPLTLNEYQYLRKHKLNLEERFRLQIVLPEEIWNLNNAFAKIRGTKGDIQILRNFLQMKLRTASKDRPISPQPGGDSSSKSKNSEKNKKRKNSPQVAITAKRGKFNELPTNSAQFTSLQHATASVSYNTARTSTSNHTSASEDDSVVIIGEIIRNNLNSFSTSYNTARASTSNNTSASEDDSVVIIGEIIRNNLNSFSTSHQNETASASYNTACPSTSDNNTSASEDDSVVIIEEIIWNNSNLSRRNGGSFIFLDNSTDEESIPSTSRAGIDSIILLDDSDDDAMEVSMPVGNLPRISSASIERILLDRINIGEVWRPVGNMSSTSRASYNRIILSDNSNVSGFPRPAIGLRHIVIDGSNVAREHGKGKNTYSSRGIQICVDYFLKLGHKVTVFVPAFRKHTLTGPYPTTGRPILDELERSGHLVYSPTGMYDDRFVIQLAAVTGGVIVSNDKFRDIKNESALFKKTIQERLLKFSFAEDVLLFPVEPLGSNGPSLEKFLKFPRN